MKNKGERLIKVRLDRIVPCHYDDPKRFPVDPVHVEQLIESINSTGFWANLIGRELPNGKFEAAFGRHRLAALIKRLGAHAEVSVIARDLTDLELVQAWSRENLTQRKQTPLILQQVVRGVLRAYAEGVIELEAPPKDTAKDRIRFVNDPPCEGDRRPYTAVSLAKFLGQTKGDGAALNSISETLAAIDLIDQAVLKEKQFIGMGSLAKAALLVQHTASEKRGYEQKVKALVKEGATSEKIARVKIEGAKVVKAVATKVAEAISEGTGRRRTPFIAREAAALARESVTGRDSRSDEDIMTSGIANRAKRNATRELPSANLKAQRFAKAIKGFLNRDGERAQTLHGLIKYSYQVGIAEWDDIAVALEHLSKDAAYWRTEVENTRRNYERAAGLRPFNASGRLALPPPNGNGHIDTR